jgi:hypothetical protein
MSRIYLADGKRAGQKVQRKIAVAVQNVKPLYFLSLSDSYPAFFLLIATTSNKKF